MKQKWITLRIHAMIIIYWFNLIIKIQKTKIRLCWNSKGKLFLMVLMLMLNLLWCIEKSKVWEWLNTQEQVQSRSHVTWYTFLTVPGRQRFCRQSGTNQNVRSESGAQSDRTNLGESSWNGLKYYLILSWKLNWPVREN